MSLRKMLLNINGVERFIMCEPEEDSLADVLRRLGFTGTKIGCNAGQCGACSVLLEGAVVRSCMKKMKAVPEFSNIQTIEGIGTPDHLHPLQVAWMVYGGVQCGFCSPGFIVSAKGLLEQNPDPSRQEVRAWFQKHRNACRCTGYKPLVDAVMAAAKVMRGEMTMEELSFKIPKDGRIYNTAIPRPTALSKVTGTCDYGADINMKLPGGALHLAVVLARVSHAKLLSIETAEAEQMPGVYQVITHKDIKGSNRIVMAASSPVSLNPGNERPILMDDKIFRYGDVCALVAADNEKNARAAAAKVKINYEPLPEYQNVLDALHEDTPNIHAGIPNMYYEQPVIFGEDTEAIMESAPYVAEGSFSTQAQPHLVIEPDVALAYIDEEDRLAIHCKSLGLVIIKYCIGEGLGISADKIRVIENPTGASFGYSISPGTAALVGAAALATGKPCCLQLNYEEHNHFTGKRAASYSNLKMAADENGKLLAMEFEIAYDKGAYAEGAHIIARGTRFMGAPYAIPNAIGTSKAVCTNHTYSTAFRSYGSPQTSMATEQIIDELAEKAGIDPLEFRYQNVYHPGDVSICGHGFSVYPMPHLLDELRPKYQEALARAQRESTPEKRRGVGIACGTYVVSGNHNDHSEVALELNPDGTITHFNSWEDQGQGGDVGTFVHTHESLKPLGIKPEQIRLFQNDTAFCPDSGLAAGSRSNFMNGNATIDAANKLMDAMRKEDGTYRTYAEMVAEGIPTKYLGVFDTTGITWDLDPNTGQGNPSPEYSYGVFMAEVAVDTKTGKTEVLKITLEADVGVISNWLAVEGQAYGGISQGIGFALSEDYSNYKKHVNLIGSGFPYIEDIPDQIEVHHTETPRPLGPHGSGGCAELYMTSPHTAICNAIHNACGIRVRELPVTPEKVLAGLEMLEKGEIAKPKKYLLGPELHEHIEEIKKHPFILPSDTTEGAEDKPIVRLH